MATSNSTQILVDTTSRTVIKRIGIFDSAGGDEKETVIIEPLKLFGALNANGAYYQTGNTTPAGLANSAFTISRVLLAVDAEIGHLQLKWQGTTASATIVKNNPIVLVKFTFGMNTILYGVPIFILPLPIWSIEPNDNLPLVSVTKFVTSLPESNIILSNFNFSVSYFIISCNPAKLFFVMVPSTITLPPSNFDTI
jgi:hypothetical protein